MKQTKEVKKLITRCKLVLEWVNNGDMCVQRATDETYGYVLGISAFTTGETLDNITDIWTYFHMAIHPAYDYDVNDFNKWIESH